MILNLTENDAQLPPEITPEGTANGGVSERSTI